MCVSHLSCTEKLCLWPLFSLPLGAISPSLKREHFPVLKSPSHHYRSDWWIFSSLSHAFVTDSRFMLILYTLSIDAYIQTQTLSAQGQRCIPKLHMFLKSWAFCGLGHKCFPLKTLQYVLINMHKNRIDLTGGKQSRFWLLPKHTEVQK